MALSDDDPRPPYQQIADDLRDQIASGVLAPGRRLPSTRNLMERYEVANQTVQSAMRILRNDELIHSVAGRGTYVREDAIASARPETPPSPQYEQIMSQLDHLAAEMARIDERLAELEADKASTQGRKAVKPKPRSNRPTR